MRKLIFILLLTHFFNTPLFAQITLYSNGYKSEFKRIDSLYFTEYKGQKSRVSKTNKNLYEKLIQLDSSIFGIITKQKNETDTIDHLIGKDQKLFQTSFYAYTPNGSLQAPTSTLFFIPKSKSNVQMTFESYGVAIVHPSIAGGYYLQLNTAIYNTGDRILALCNTFF